MYTTTKGFGFVEEDNYEKGCLPGTDQYKEIDITFKGETKEEILTHIMNFYDVDEDDIETNACDEPGRIDIALMENAKGEKATISEIEQWKKGKIKLYYVVYTHHLTKNETVAF